MLAPDKPIYTRYSTHLGDIDVMQARYVKQNFAKHYHEGYGLGVITSGAMEFNYRGEKLIASEGLVNSVNPDEAHDGHSFDSEGWCYSMLYFEESVFRNLYGDICEKYETPFITEGVFKDKHLATNLSFLVAQLLSKNSDRLLNESQIIGILSSTILKHSDKRPDVRKIYKLGNKLTKVKEHIKNNINQKISIKQLADIAGVSLYHFIRSFTADVGVAPYEYVSMQRARRAKELILAGKKAVDVAIECGYTDQSHMNRWLKKIYGITPRALSNIVL